MIIKIITRGTMPDQNDHAFYAIVDKDNRKFKVSLNLKRFLIRIYQVEDFTKTVTHDQIVKRSSLASEIQAMALRLEGVWTAYNLLDS
jgi:hypothetical protein